MVDNLQDATAAQDQMRQAVGAAPAGLTAGSVPVKNEENEHTNLASRHTNALRTLIGSAAADPPVLQLQAVNLRDARAVLTLCQLHQGPGAASADPIQEAKRNGIGLREQLKYPEQRSQTKLQQEGVHTLAAEQYQPHYQVVSTAVDPGCLQGAAGAGQ